MRLACVPEETNRPACLPSKSAPWASSWLMVVSSPYTSSPTSASYIALRIATSGFVTVSLRKSSNKLSGIKLFSASSINVKIEGAPSVKN